MQVTMLLEAGAYVNQGRITTGSTPVYTASMHGCVEVVRATHINNHTQLHFVQHTQDEPIGKWYLAAELE